MRRPELRGRDPLGARADPVSPTPSQSICLVVDIRNYTGTAPMRLIDPDLKVLRPLGPLAAWIVTSHPDRWGYSLNGRYIPGAADERIRGIRVFPATTLTDAQRQITTWGWNDQAALDA